MRKQRNVRFEESQDDRLQAYADRIGLTVSALVRVAAIEYLDQHERGSAGMYVSKMTRDELEQGIIGKAWGAATKAHNWLGCYPVVVDGVIVGVCDADHALAGDYAPDECNLDGSRECYVPRHANRKGRIVH